MAIWQVSVVLTNEANNLNDQRNTQWNSLNELVDFFPEEKSWCDSIRQFGSLDSTCIEIDLEAGDISLRMDLRNITREQLETITKFAVSNKLKIKYKNRIQDPTFNNFIGILKSSDAYRFINDPEGFFEVLATGK